MKHKAVPLNGGLTVNIVGGIELPTDPKEGTVWINTDTKIGRWQFCATEPIQNTDGTALQDGDVWVKTNNLSPIYFNAIKKNAIYVYCSLAYQRQNGAWVSKDIKGYRNGEWITSVIVVVDVDRGIIDTNWSKVDGHMQVSQQTTGLQFYHYALNAQSYVVCDTEYDLTPFSKITFEVVEYTRCRLVYIGVSADKSLEHSNSSADLSCFDKYIQIPSKGTFTMDITDLKGIHYLKFRFSSAKDETSPKVIFSKIILE